jgi:hypothetical protein
MARYKSYSNRNRSVSIEYWVDRDDQEIELTIKASVSPYVPAKFSGHPDTWAPAEGGEVEITDVLLNDEPWDGDLTRKEIERIEELVLEGLEDNRDFDPDDGFDDPDYWDDSRLEDE